MCRRELPNLNTTFGEAYNMFKIKRIAAAAALSTAMVSPSVMADLTGNISVFSEYLFRGFQESGGEPAVQGGLDYSHESGFYVGTWISTLSSDYFDSGESSGAYETDLYAGYGFEVGDLAFDLGVLYYYYRGDTSLNTVEIYGSVGYGPFALGLSYGEEVFGSDSDLLYTNVSAEFPLTDTVSLGAYVGFSSFSGGDAKDYFDYGVTLAKDLGDGFSFSIGVIGADRPSQGVVRTEQLVLGLTKEFDF
jgi:uncharacterized protein (TIGR02001 family)